MNSAGLTPAPRRTPRYFKRVKGYPVLAQFVIISLLALVLIVTPLALVVSDGDAGRALPAILAFAIVALATAGFLKNSDPHDRLGLCNVVTLSRAALISVLAVPLSVPGLLAQSPGLAWTIVIVTTIALCLDGIDGWLARRAGLVSGFGARFDIEIDSLLALGLAILLYQSDKAGAWVLGLGLIRYGFVVAGLILPWLNAPLPERFSRKLVCVIQIATLVALVSPVINQPYSVWIAAAATVMLIWSFAVDIVWLARNRS